MRLSELHRLVDDEFGPAYGRHLLRTQVLPALADRTVEQAVAAGEDPRRAWSELCREMDVPAERRLGRDRPLREGAGMRDDG